MSFTREISQQFSEGIKVISKYVANFSVFTSSPIDHPDSEDIGYLLSELDKLVKNGKLPKGLKTSNPKPLHTFETAFRVMIILRNVCTH